MMDICSCTVLQPSDITVYCICILLSKDALADEALLDGGAHSLRRWEEAVPVALQQEQALQREVKGVNEMWCCLCAYCDVHRGSPSGKKRPQALSTRNSPCSKANKEL